MISYSTDMLMGHHFLSYVPLEEAFGASVWALDGNQAARCLLADHLTEHGEKKLDTFKKGNKVLIKTVTLYFCGEVEGEDGFLVKLKTASWVHWTGQLSVLLANKTYTGFANPESRARTEFVGEVLVSKASMVAVYESDEWALPTTSIS